MFNVILTAKIEIPDINLAENVNKVINNKAITNTHVLFVFDISICYSSPKITI